jgi:hypothetical protein
MGFDMAAYDRSLLNQRLASRLIRMGDSYAQSDFSRWDTNCL